MSVAPVSPLRYTSSTETIQDDEQETITALIDSMREIATITAKDYGHAVRSVHAKSHGVLRGTLSVNAGLPEELTQGLFATPVTFPLVMRLSTSPGDILDDKVSTPRGMAIKLVGVSGARLEGADNDVTQDFVLVNGPAFMAPDAKSFVKSVKLLAKTTDKAPGLKKALSAVLRGTEKALESVGGESGTLKGLGGHPYTNMLGETFYTQVPILYGAYMAKIRVAPVSPELQALKDAPLESGDSPDALREAVVDYFRRRGAEWEVAVQLCTNIETMPIEDASVVWPEGESPYVPVARITLPQQDAWSEARVTAVNDSYSFSPWHCLAAHRPLGSIMRARKAVYEMSSQFRAHANNRSISEPLSLDGLPD